MKSEMVRKPKTITLTPSWVFTARILVECIKHGVSESAKAEAEAELMRMAKLLDLKVAECEALK